MEELLALISNLFAWFAHHGTHAIRGVSHHEKAQILQVRHLVRELARELLSGGPGSH
jgi:hypothetical protein